MCIIVQQGVGSYSCNVTKHSARGMSILTRVQVLYVIQEELSECNEDTTLVPSNKELPCALYCGKFLEHNVGAQHSVYDVGLRKFQSSSRHALEEARVSFNL